MKELQIAIQYFAVVGLCLSLIALFSLCGGRVVFAAAAELRRKIGAFGPLTCPDDVYSVTNLSF